MANQLFRSELRRAIADARQKAENAAGIFHSGLQGRVREIAVEAMLRPFIPGVFEFGTGKLIDSFEWQSPEVDVIVYSPGLLPPVSYDGRLGLFPVEAAVFAIEVKSTVNATQLRSAITLGQQLRNARLRPGRVDAAGQLLDHEVTAVVPAFFAFDTDLTEAGKTELQRYCELDPDHSTDPAIRMLCVAGRGHWWFDPQTSWQHFPPTDDGEEILDFIVGIGNTAPIALASRGMPRVGHYYASRQSVPVAGLGSPTEVR